MEENTFIIETNNLSKKFGNKWAVSNLNLQVERGHIFGLLGPNGSGKSTTIRLLMGLLKPTEGEFELFGKTPSLIDRRLYHNIGTIVEEPQFYNYLSAKQNLYRLGSLNKKVSKDEINDILVDVGLKNKGHMEVSKFSHGMKKRLGVAQALLNQPDLLVLDEPTSGLDPEGIQRITKIFENFVEEQEGTIFLTSHQLEEVESICSHMAIIDHGKLVVQDSVKKLLTDTDLFTTELIVDRPNKALNILMDKSFVNKASLKNGKLNIHVSPEDRYKISKILVEQNFKLSGVIPRTSLKNYYLSLLNHQ